MGLELEVDLTALSERVDALARGLARLEDRVDAMEGKVEFALTLNSATSGAVDIINGKLEEASREMRRHDAMIADALRKAESASREQAMAAIITETPVTTAVAYDPDVPF